MKKHKFLKALLVTSVIAAIAITACFGLVACDEEHQHTYSEAWNYDETNHWHDATCEHSNEKDGLAAHDTNGADGKCSVCGYKATSEHQHTYATAWSKDATNHWHAATCEHSTEKGSLAAHDTKGANGACSVCGYKATSEHQHTYAQAWTTDATNHWHAATCEHSTEKGSLAAHDTNGQDGACSVCGYKATSEHQHTYAEAWTTDATNHWHAATCEHSNEKGSLAAHDTNGQDGACSVCGYKATSEHQHTYAQAWTTDATNHWHAATCEHSNEKGSLAAHDTNGQDGACSVCGYKATSEHQHTYAEAWSYDATNHWHAATCEHETEQSALAAHDTNGENGACSVCGYNIYNELAAKEGMIIAEKFETAAAKLPEFSGTLGTQGIYMTGESEGHYVKVEGGKAVMVDPGAGETRTVIDFGLTSGVVEGYLEATIDGATNNSWTFLRLVNVKGQEIFALRSDGGNIKYRLDGGSVATPNSTIAFDKTTYKIYFKFDGATKKLTMTINSSDFVKDLDLSDSKFDASELGGILLVSGGGHVGVVNLDNLVIVNDIALADLKTVAKEKLQAAYEAYDLAANYTQNGGNVTTAKNTGDTEITAAETRAAVVVAYDKAVAAMKAVESDEQIAAAAALAEAKQSALAALSAHKGGADNFTVEGEEGNKAAYEAAIAAGTAAINAATTPDEVTTALNAAKAVIDEIYTNEQLVATKYKVTFVNSPVEEQEVVDGEKVVKPDDPTDADAVFVNWYSNAACTELYDFNTAITADTKIYAKWEGKLVQVTGSSKYGCSDFSTLAALPATGATSDATTSDAYIVWNLNTSKDVLDSAAVDGYTKMLKVTGSAQSGRNIELHLAKAGTVKVVFYLTSADTNGRWVSIDKEIQSKTASADKSATETAKTTAKTLECEVEAGDWYLNFNNQIAICEITITISSTSTTYFTGITGTPTTTYDAVPTAETVNLAGLALAVKGSEDTVALTDNSVKAKVSVVVNAPEQEGGSYSITVKYGNYVTYTYDITVAAAEVEPEAL